MGEDGLVSAANMSVALLGMDSAIDALLPGVCRRGWPITGLHGVFLYLLNADFKGFSLIKEANVTRLRRF